MRCNHFVNLKRWKDCRINSKTVADSLSLSSTTCLYANNFKKSSSNAVNHVNKNKRGKKEEKKKRRNIVCIKKKKETEKIGK